MRKMNYTGTCAQIMYCMILAMLIVLPKVTYGYGVKPCGWYTLRNDTVDMVRYDVKWSVGTSLRTVRNGTVGAMHYDAIASRCNNTVRRLQCG